MSDKDIEQSSRRADEKPVEQDEQENRGTAEEKKAGVGTGEFIVRAVFVTACAVAVLYFVKIWVVDTLKETFTAKNSYEAKEESPAAQEKKSWSKEKVKIAWQDAADYVGAYVSTKGTIVSAYNNGKVCYLNFHKDYKNHLTLVIFASSFKKFPGYPEKAYLGKEIEVEGRVKDYKGRVEIIIDSPEQIKISGQ